ncbi:battenin CLN3 protein [Rhodosporidiobolus nylandii]
MTSPTRSRSLRSSSARALKARFAAAFFALGCLNNIIYVVILSAALDLVDKASTPKGLILFVNIAPALLVKIGWPYFVPGPTRYGTRVGWCSGLSFFGILIVALSPTLTFRLLGIALASFSSGLGEMTYLQRATLYGSLSPSSFGAEEDGGDLGGVAVGWFASGTGAAGVGGAGLWWLVRGLGVRRGVGVCAVLPLCMSLAYFLLLPPLSAFSPSSPFLSTSQSGYSPLAADGDASDSDGEDEGADATVAVEEAALRRAAEKAALPSLTTQEKVELARPLVRRFMLPLFFVYLAEYTINSGVAPTLLYEVPTRESAPVLHLAIKNLRDYYPYLCILFLTLLESSTSLFVSLAGEHGATYLVALLICAEGLCGGGAYVNAFHRLAVMQHDEEEEEGLGGGKSAERRKQEKEFRVASVGFADTLGILLASLVSSALEPALCAGQVARRRMYCKEL